MKTTKSTTTHLLPLGFILFFFVFISIGCGGGGGSNRGGGGGSGPTHLAKLNTDTAVSLQSASIAFNSAGDAMAAWYVYNGSSENKLLYSVYTQATDTWSDEAELGATNYEPAVCSDGTDFMVVWTNIDVLAREYSVSSGTWGAETAIDSVSNSYWANSPHVASNGTGYCAVWHQWDGANQRIYANIYSSGAWGAETTLGSATGTSYFPEAASNGTGYGVIWQRNDSGTNNIYASIYTGSWSTETALEAAGGDVYNPHMTSDGSGYGATWYQYDGAFYSIYANIYSGAAWGGATLIESGAYDAYVPKIDSDGTGYGVVWAQSDGTNNRIYGNHYDNSVPGWGVEFTVDSGSGDCYSPDVAASSNGYGVSWSRWDGSTMNIVANTYDRVADAWGTETLLESGTGDADFPRCASDGSGYGVIWARDDGAQYGVYASLSSGSGWGTERSLMQDPHHASVTGGIRFAANSAGDVLAIWGQYDKDGPYLFGRLYNGGWGAVFEIDNGINLYDVSSDGSGFMIIYSRSGRIYAVGYDLSTGLGTEEQISGNDAWGDCRITSNGTGYCATWRQYVTSNYRIFANMYDGSNWQGYATLTPIDTGSGDANDPSIASNGTGYCVTWSQYDGMSTNDIWVGIHDGSSWDSATTIDSDPNFAQSPQVASDGTGYGVVWLQNSSIWANLYEGTPLAWGTATLTETGSGGTYLPQVASNGTGYGATWTQYDGSQYSIFANLYDGSWGTEVAIESGTGYASYPKASSNGTGYCVGWVQNDGIAGSLYVNTFDGTTWGTEQVLESSDTEVNTDWAGRPNVVAVQNTYTIGWLQRDENDSLIDNAWAYSGLGD